jgi:outer membrane protein TolC
MIQRSRESYALAGKDYWPDVTLGVNYIGIGDRPDDPAVAPSGQGDDAWNVVVMFNIPLPNARRTARLEQARKKEEAARYQQEALGLEIQETLHTLGTRLKSLDDQLHIYEQSLLPLAQETFNTSQTEYLAGMGSFLELLDSERTLLETRFSFLRLVRDYRLALADLERTVGARLDVDARE